MPWHLKKEPDKGRIVLSVTGDELVAIIPDEIIEVIEADAEIGNGSAQCALDEMETGILKFYLPLNSTKLEGF